LVDELQEQKELAESFRVQLALAQARIISLEQHLEKPVRSLGVQTDMVRHDFDFYDGQESSNSRKSSLHHEESSPLHDITSASIGDDLVLSRESSISSNSSSHQQPAPARITTQQQFVTNAHEFGLVHPLATERRWDEDINHITRQLNHVNIVTPEAQRNRAIGSWLDRLAL
jgi:hypothetical protein